MLESLTVHLGAPAERVWSVAGDLNGLPQWHPWVESSVLDSVARGVGRRVVNVGGAAGRRELMERLVCCDVESHQYAYTILAGRRRSQTMWVAFEVLPRSDGRCTFEFSCLFKAAPGKPTRRLQNAFEFFMRRAWRISPRSSALDRWCAFHAER